MLGYHLENVTLFSNFYHSFKSSRWTEDLLTFVFFIGRFIDLGLPEQQHLVCSRLFTGFSMLVFFANLSPMEFHFKCLTWFFDLFFLFNWRLRVVLDEKSLEGSPLNAGVPQSSIIGPTPFLLGTDDPPNDVICNMVSMPMILLSSLSLIRRLICDNN